MKGLKKGPELKMPELKVPPFLVDLYWDLRDRRLLPLVVLVVVAIVAVPFLLGGGSEEADAAAGRRRCGGLESPAIERAKLTVVEAKPGLRDYRKRLADRRPTDPFKQRYTAPVLKGAKLKRRRRTSRIHVDEHYDDDLKRHHHLKRRNHRRIAERSHPADLLRLRGRRQDHRRPGPSPAAARKRASQPFAAGAAADAAARREGPGRSPTWAQPEDSAGFLGLRRGHRGVRRSQVRPGAIDLPAARSRTGHSRYLRLRRQRRPLQDRRAQGRAGRDRA